MTEFNEANLLNMVEMLGQSTENVEKVYEAGYSVGKRDGLNFGGYTEGFEAGKQEGKQEEYDAFWDMIQQKGNRADYSYAFLRWGGQYIRPKYKVIPTACAKNVVTIVPMLSR